jgi:sugar lactone lactonase YvrE
MRPPASFFPIMMLIGAIPACGASTSYMISFAANAGSPVATGSFSYDPALANSFANFLVEWGGLVFNFTNVANTGGAAQIFNHPVCANGLTGAAATFYLLTQCPQAGWSGGGTATSSTFIFSESDGGGANLFDLAVTAGPLPQAASASGSFTSFALPESVYIADTQNARIRAVSGAGLITTVAGNGGWGYNGDQEQALAATLNKPDSVAVDSAGNFYIADTANNRVRKVNLSGAIFTVAGGGFAGDGGLATAASLSTPVAIALDVQGNLYIAGGNRVRKVTASTGVITTVAGTGSSGLSGDGAQAATAALNGPSSVAVDSFGNLFIADAYNNRIRRVNAAGIITTVAGNGSWGSGGDGGSAVSAQLANPSGIAVDGNGNIYIADYTNSKIRKVTVASGIITTVAGNGIPGYNGDNLLATTARLNYPTAVAVDGSNNIYIADLNNNRIRKVTALSGIITTFAGNGSAGYSGDRGSAIGAMLFQPVGVAVPPLAAP